jgi:hypothetical protein
MSKKLVLRGQFVWQVPEVLDVQTPVIPQITRNLNSDRSRKEFLRSNVLVSSYVKNSYFSGSVCMAGTRSS